MALALPWALTVPVYVAKALLETLHHAVVGLEDAHRTLVEDFLE
jgi:hypothetical protein